MQWIIDIIKNTIIPPGCIIIWYGLWKDIPNGWGACDGLDGKPDLRTKFVRGAGSGVGVGDTGGTLVHSHLGDMTHEHTIDAGTGLRGGGMFNDFTAGPVGVGQTGFSSTLPPWKGYWYIVKL